MSDQRQICYALDLVDDETLINEYEEFHKPGKVWPEITNSIRQSGIEDMEIYRVENRLFMIVKVNDQFDEVHKAETDKSDPKVQEWENLMSIFQVPIRAGEQDQKWIKMNKIFKLDD